MRLTLVTPPAEEPVTLAEMKLHLRVEHAADDALITSLIKAARQVCEARTGRAFVTQTWDLTLDALDAPIRLPLAPVVSVASVSYLHVSGVPATLATSQYVVSAGTPGRISMAYGAYWPTPLSQADAVTVRFTAGYGNAAAVPESIKAAIKLLVGHLYEHREAAAEAHVGGGVTELPLGVGYLLAAEATGAYQ